MMSTVDPQPTYRPRVVLIANNPAPYRIPVFTIVGAAPDFDLRVLFSTEREPMREWDLSSMKFQHEFMKSFFFNWKGNPVHVNTDVVGWMRRARPDLIILTGFNPTNLLAFWHARRHGCKVALLIDGTDESELHLSAMHRWVRGLVYPHLSVVFGPSEGTFRLFKSYGVPPDRMFKSHLCADNAAFEKAVKPARPEFDLIYCGRFTEHKHPDFALQVAARMAELMQRRVSILMVGSGGMDDALRAQSATLANVRTEFAGFAKQHELPGHYARAGVLLFPTSYDPWGVVANEACASGVPVVVTRHAGVTGELVVDGVNGYVLPLDVDAWARACVTLLTDESLYASMAAQCRKLVQPYTFDNAAQGLMDGIRQALKP